MIKTWQQRCEEHPDHNGIVSDGMIQARMQEEIDELRAAIEQAQPDELMIWKSRALHAERMIEKFMQPEQEPVAWMYHGIRHDDTPHERPSLIWKPEYMDVMSFEKGAKATPLYTAPRKWQGLTEDDVKAPIQRAMQHFGFDPTQYSLGGLATIGFLGLVKEIETKLRERNT